MSISTLTVPPTAKRGEIITVKALIHHPMEAGDRQEADGRPIPRLILNHVACRYNDKVVFEADWGAAIAGNPYLAFDLRAGDSGVIELTWTDDRGQNYRDQAAIEVR